MNLKDVFQTKTVFSLEVFPPKSELATQKLLNSLTGIQSIKPDFISITLGAAQMDIQKTVNLATAIQEQLSIPAMAHLTGLYLSKQQAADTLSILKESQINNILALRGDQVSNCPPVGDFKYAAELVNFIKCHGDFDIAGACYPQKHPESSDFVADTLHLKEKVNQGASHLITQMIFDNEAFWQFKERLQLANINVPIEVGIMPCTNHQQIQRITALSGIQMPKKFTNIMARYADNKEAMRDAGIAYAIDQIVDLVASGVDGIHLYTMNNPENAQRIWEATHTLFEAQNKQLAYPL
ncbi:methylenetetrahydrofolate reductase [NAD(P)H] [Convivina intestini]|uniref:methylenetetrahydrofolate reductase [NAD(P)H] n=1 Tax=Convivina intestini TaxID=1505726 RepID=UPI00200FE933|nr:methylenetetrahydrofolate reductase [NAD(P)H] [Convivina intestini]CAH1857126.1 5,10-methylenetetrahydrofolate reductase [Convivina intestini]